jgi:hypothetical protein
MQNKLSNLAWFTWQSIFLNLIFLFFFSSIVSATSGVDSKMLYVELLKYSSYRQGAIRKLPPSQFTPIWLKNNGTFRPVLIPAPSEEGASAAAIVKTPAGGISAETLVMSLGPTTPVHIFDSPSQEEGPLWTLHQWKLYWNKKTMKPAKPHNDGAVVADTAVAPSKPSDPPLEGIDKDYLTRLLCLPALQITGTSLESEISAPAAVQSADLCSNLGLVEAIPQAQLPILLGMYPNRSFVNSTMAPGGASVWIHLVSGTATIAVSPPVPKNIATYAAWACGGKSTGYFLHSKCEGSAKAELVAGDTLLLPPGYTYSLAVTSSAEIVSGGFLRSDSLAIHLDAFRIEKAAGISPRRQYPEFKQLMWRTAAKYAVLLTGLAKNKMENVDSIEGKVASRALEMEREDKKAAEKTAAQARAAAAAAKVASRPSSAAGAAHRQDAAGRRKKRKTDAFIASDSDLSGGGGGDDGDDEGEWVPGARQHRGKADSEENSGEEEDDDVLDSDAEQMDLEYSDYDDDGNGGGSGRIGRQKHGGNKRGGGLVRRVTGERQSKRQRSRRGEDVEAAPPQALNLAGVPPSSLKLKLKLPMVNTAALPQQPKPSPIKLTIKRPTPLPAAAAAETAPALPQPSTTIPQVDGAGDDAYVKDHLELTEGEEQGLPVLYLTLRRWLQESPAAAILASTALSGSSPWTVLARVEFALKALKLIDASDEDHPPPVCVNLTAVSAKTLEPTGAPFQEKITLFNPSAGSGDNNNNNGGNNGDKYGDDGDSMDYESGDNVAMIDTFQEDSYFKLRGGGGGFTNRPSSAMGAASDGKGASNGGALGGDTAGGRFNVPATVAAGGATKKATTPDGGGKSTTPLNKSAAAKMKKLSTKDRLKKKLGL